MKNILIRFFPKKKEQGKQVDLRNQIMYKLAVHPRLLIGQDPIVDLLITYKQSIDACIREAIDNNKDKIGYVPFTKTCTMSSIFRDDTDKDNLIYLLIKFKIFYADMELCKYVVELLTLKPILLDEYLDYYNEGLNCGMIPTETKQQ